MHLVLVFWNCLTKLFKDFLRRFHRLFLKFFCFTNQCLVSSSTVCGGQMLRCLVRQSFTVNDLSHFDGSLFCFIKEFLQCVELPQTQPRDKQADTTGDSEEYNRTVHKPTQ